MGSLAVAAVSAVALTTTGCDTSWINTAIADIPTAESIITSFVGIAAAATGDAQLAAASQALIVAAGTAAKAGLATLQALIDGYKTSPNASILDKIDTALTDVATNLSSILAVVGIKDDALRTTIFTAVSLALVAVQAIQLLIPAAATATASRKAAQVQLKKKAILLTKDQLASLFNTSVTINGYPQYQIQ